MITTWNPHSRHLRIRTGHRYWMILTTGVGVVLLRHLAAVSSFRFSAGLRLSQAGSRYRGYGCRRGYSSVRVASNGPLPKDSVVQVDILELTSQGDGFARYKTESGTHPDSAGWVVMVPKALPTEKVTCRVVENHKSYRSAAPYTALLQM
jgi:predicted RNA-binding protein with TRAM domain